MCCFCVLGFNPRWDCTFNFTIHVPDLALVRFMVEDYDYTSRNDFLGQCTLPFTSLRTGVCVFGLNGGCTKDLFVLQALYEKQFALLTFFSLLSQVVVMSDY